MRPTEQRGASVTDPWIRRSLETSTPAYDDWQSDEVVLPVKAEFPRTANYLRKQLYYGQP